VQDPMDDVCAGAGRAAARELGLGADDAARVAAVVREAITEYLRRVVAGANLAPPQAQ
jgi:hypothetical protein